MAKKDTNTKTKKALEELANFSFKASVYADKYPKERSKVTFALQKLSQKYEKKQKDLIQKLNNELQDKIDKVTILNASLKDGNLIENRFDFKVGFKGEETQIRYAFTPEKKIQVDAEISKLRKEYKEKFEEITVEIEPFFVPIPDGFDMSFYESFKDFIFEPISEDQELELYLAQKNPEPSENGQKPTIRPLLKD